MRPLSYGAWEVLLRSSTKGLAGLVAALIAFMSPLTSQAADLIGLDHFALNVTDLQRSADWYAKNFGFHMLHKWNTTWMIGRDNMKIGLFLRPSAKPLPDIDSQLIIQHVAFLVDGDKFDAAVQELKANGLAIDGPEDTGIAYSVFVKDPDGHLLELTTYHPVTAPSTSPLVPAPTK
jgi:catechol 2,3-dioxygenase-like lactoylglutathione lyase family enzyme